MNKHIVQFYKNEDLLFPAVGQYLSEGLKDGACVVIATEAHCRSFRAVISTSRNDLADLIASGRLTILDAEKTLSMFMVDDMPDPVLFEAAIGPVLRAASQGGCRPVRAYGEMVDLLWRQGKARSAIRLEELWNQLAKRLSFVLMCAYQLVDLDQRLDDLSAKDLCGTHSHSMTLESYGLTEGRVLVAEDDEDDLDFLRHVFGRIYPQIRLENVKDGEEAMRWLQLNRHAKPSVMLLDLNMPLKDGREVLGELRNDAHFDDMPVIVLTTSNSKADERFTDCFRNTYFFSKPIGVARYEGLVHTVVQRHLALAR